MESAVEGEDCLIPQSLVKTELLEPEQNYSQDASLELQSEIKLGKNECTATASSDLDDEKLPKSIETVFIKSEAVEEEDVETVEEPNIINGNTECEDGLSGRQSKHTMTGTEDSGGRIVWPSPVFGGLKPLTGPELARLTDFRLAPTTSHPLLRTETVDGRKTHFCRLCPYKSLDKSAVTNHLVTHTGEKPYKCESCPYRCGTKVRLRQHVKAIHAGIKNYLCEICSYRSLQANNLKVHMLTHTGEKPFSCDLCPFRCSRQSSLKLHSAVHTKIKPHKCDLCGYSSSDASNLKRHAATHADNVKPHKCDYCDYRGAFRRDLTQHVMRRHTGERPYECAHCDFRTAHRSDLVRHFNRKNACRSF